MGVGDRSSEGAHQLQTQEWRESATGEWRRTEFTGRSAIALRMVATVAAEQPRQPPGSSCWLPCRRGCLHGNSQVTDYLQVSSSLLWIVCLDWYLEIWLWCLSADLVVPFDTVIDSTDNIRGGVFTHVTHPSRLCAKLLSVLFLYYRRVEGKKLSFFFFFWRKKPYFFVLAGWWVQVLCNNNNVPENKVFGVLFWWFVHVDQRSRSYTE